MSLGCTLGQPSHVPRLPPFFAACMGEPGNEARGEPGIEAGGEPGNEASGEPGKETKGSQLCVQGTVRSDQINSCCSDVCILKMDQVIERLKVITVVLFTTDARYLIMRSCLQLHQQSYQVNQLGRTH